VLNAFADEFQTDNIGNPIFRRGHMMPIGIALVQETTVFREYGPVAGNTFRLALDYSPDLGGEWLTRTTAQVDARHYTRLATNGVFAVRFKGFRSFGTNPDFMYFGGNSEMRGYDYLEFYGQHAFFANAELRFPIIEAMLTPIGVLGGLRGVFFANMGGAGFNGVPYELLTNSSTEYRPLIGYDVDIFGQVRPIYSPLPEVVSGFRLVDGRASYGFGLQSMILGFPIHFDWAWRTLFNERWEDLTFRSCFPGNVINSYICGPAGPQFRRVQFKFWMGYDF
jgi:outer membrane protein assembly factor BamA